MGRLSQLRPGSSVRRRSHPGHVVPARAISRLARSGPPGGTGSRRPCRVAAASVHPRGIRRWPEGVTGRGRGVDLGPGGPAMVGSGGDDPVKPEVGDRTDLWLALVRRLTEVCPKWTIWKNADAAFNGLGDIDSAAPMEDWETIVLEFRRWAASRALGPVIECRHPPKTMFLLTPDRSTSTLLELDVLGRKYFRGWTLFRAEDLANLSEIDVRGFRRLRPGSQGLILLLGNGLKWGGRPDLESLRKRHVRELLEQDPEGAREAAWAFRLPRRAVASAVRSLLAGEWAVGPMWRIEASAAMRAFGEPAILAKRARF